MSLPIVTLPTDERWDCHQCGICCRGSLVPLSDADVARLKEQHWEQKPEYARTPVMVRSGLLGGYRLAQRADGSCVFLNEQGLCRIHAELGFEAKPTICRTFPLQLVPHEKEAVLTLRRACPSSAADRGRGIDEHLPFVREFVKEGRLKAEAASPPQFKAGEYREWRTVRLVLSTFGRMLQDEHYPPVRRLVQVLRLAALLEQARTKEMEHAQLADLIQVLEGACPEEATPFFENRRPPGAAAGVLFRLAALEYVRLHPGYRAQRRWFERVHLAKTAWRMTRGRGSLPKIHPGFPAATFAQLDEPLGKVDPAVLKPLSRFLETSAESQIYALANRSQWTVIDSIRGLALTFPVGLWLLRWASAGREPAVDDMLNIVVALDRGQGYGPLSGWQTRMQLHLLARLGALERLVAWYAR